MTDDEAAILRLIASTGVRIVHVDWVAGRITVELPPTREVKG
jgi:hypothetical protein